MTYTTYTYMALTTVVVVKYYTAGQLRLQNSLKGPFLNFPVLPRLTARGPHKEV
jgi:hypothetical protein